MHTLAITWLGHSAFRVRTPGGKELLFDPWFTGNPVFAESARPKHADLILISHGHFAHITDAAAMAKAAPEGGFVADIAAYPDAGASTEELLGSAWEVLQKV